MCYTTIEMRRRFIPALLLLLAAHGCALIGGRAPCVDTARRLQELDAALTDAERMWREAIDDPWTEPELRRSYAEMQNLCRECGARRGGFESVEQKTLCDRVASPFEIYHNRLRVQVNNLEEQIEIKDLKGAPEPNTVAYEYKRRPSRDNLEKLRNVFSQVHRYYVGDRYTWTRYINKYAFQKSRSDHFGAAFAARDAEYRALRDTPGAERREVRLARKRAEFAFKRLKNEYLDNDLPPAGEVNAFFLARSLDDYHRLAREEAADAATRAANGRRKEVVVFVHGLGETRRSWGRLPELLAREDTVNPLPGGIYFKVYLFQYDTVEDSKSVEGFKNELAGFISDVRRDEGVERIHLVGHSFGAVLSLKYIGHQADEFLEGVDANDSRRVAETLLRARLEGRFAPTVKSFTSVAGSLCGSEIANIAGDRFIPQERLFRRSLPLFRSGVPGYGDIQVRENQIGSEVNIASFRRLDTEHPLDPLGLLGILPKGAREEAGGDAETLRAAAIPTLCIVGDPVKIQSFSTAKGFLKLGEAWRIFWVDGLAQVLGSFQRDEDDGLVKSYSANLNHGWLTGAGEEIGYRSAGVRYAPYAHFSLCRVDSRQHPTYRYLVSFLSGRLLPQLGKSFHRIELFGTLLRVFPEGIDPVRAPGSSFMPEERVVYLDDRKLVLPRLRIRPVFDRRGGEPATENVRLRHPTWNRMTGVHFCEGRVRDLSRPARVVYLISADGYEDMRVSIPVQPGEATYAVDLTLKKKGGKP